MNTTTTEYPTDVRLYTVKEIAILLSISRDRVYQLIYSQRIPAMDIGGLKVRHDTLVEFLKSMEGYMIDFEHPKNLYLLTSKTA